MFKPKYSAKVDRLMELLTITLLGGVPTIALGSQLRNRLYRSIFLKLGNQVYIQNSVDFIGASCIEIGNKAFIFKGVRLDAKGHPNNRIHIGNQVAIERNVDIGSLENTSIFIDDDTFIGPDVSIMGAGDIKIGKQCLIAARFGIFANSHNFADPKLPIKHQGITRQGIVIEDDCWLGHGVTVLDGVTIGKGSIIGAGAVVTKDIPPFSIAVGIPARVIKSRIPQELVKNLY